MSRLFFVLIIILSGLALHGQELYFPPLSGDSWQTIEPESLGWCSEKIDELYGFLDENNTKAFLVLKDGKIVLEKYFGNFQNDSLWYWASAGKSLTAFMVGLAQEEGFLEEDDSSNQYLGKNWTNCSEDQESKITIFHQLTMTTGLDETYWESDCTMPSCLECIATPGTRWAYHNAPYTLLDELMKTATGINLNAYVLSRLSNRTGIYGVFVKLGYNNVFFSTPRVMARFGLLMLNKGVWANEVIMQDSIFFNAMVNTSQNHNKSYGYLWWLNGKESFMIPGSQFVFDGPIIPHGPEDMYAALGKNGQMLFIVPSDNLVMVRMGDAPELNGLVSLEFGREIWNKFKAIDCSSTTKQKKEALKIYPNPFRNSIYFDLQDHKIIKCELFTIHGFKILDFVPSNNKFDLNTNAIPVGVYFVLLTNDQGESYRQIALKM